MYTTENEQLDAVRNFFRENGKSLVFGLVLGLGGLFGWRYWQSHQTNTAMSASDGFESVVLALSDAKADKASVEAKVNSFITANPNSYGVTAALLAAQKRVDAQDFVGAEAQLLAAQKATKDDNLLALTNIRLARIQLQQVQYDQALATLDKVQGEGWQAQVQEIRGDIYLAQGNIDQARAAYAKGLELNPSEAISTLLQMKISNTAA